MVDKKNDCWTCAYQRKVPGSAHLSCTFNWSEWSDDPMPEGSEHGVAHGWYDFPFQFDPVWMEKPCPQWAAEVDPEKQVEWSNSFVVMTALLQGHRP